MPKVSIIVPIYNVEKYLRECLDSILNQTLKDIEIICVNDGSTDDSLEILREYEKKDSRIKVIDKNNEGVGIARNNGIDAAAGEFVCFMDPDDLYPTNDILETLYNKAIANNVLICGGEFSSFSNDNSSFVQNYNNSFAGYLFPESRLYNYKEYQYDYGFHRFLYDREFLIRNNIYFPLYKRFQDPPFLVNAMIKASKFYGVNKISYAYRRNYKKVIWTQEKIKDLLQGICDNMRYAYNNHLPNLQEYSYERFEQHLPQIRKNLTISFLPQLLNMAKYNKKIRKFIFKQIFNTICSVRNEDIRKVITIFGIKFKLKSKELEQEAKIKKLNKRIKNLKEKLKNIEERNHAAKS